ncbi:MAG: extracellular solute-binding protein [Actinomycetota bacterium]
MTRRTVARLTSLLAVTAMVAVACTSGSSTTTSGGGTSPSIAGQTITVLLPPWANVPKDILQTFTDKTGVNVDLQVTGWDAIRNKVAVAGAANTPLADVTEFDWSWTGQFGRAGWYLPLQDKLTPGLLDGLQNNGAFSVDANQYAVCYSNDFRISAYNTKMFSDAGIDKAPTTFDELTADLQKIKDAGVAENPLTMPLSATEGTATLWYLLTLAYGGQLFDENFQPAFTSPDSGGYQALQFMVDAVDKGFVTPGAVSLTDTQSDNRYTSGSAAVTLSGGPDEMVVADDPSQSKIVGDGAFMPVPGVSGPGATFGLPEGLGVMSTSAHPEASIAFLEWWEQQDTQLALQKSVGLLPCSTAAVQSLVDAGKLVGGDAINQELQHVAPLFPQGAPPWYTDFSTKAAALINAAASGDMSVQDALNQLASEAQTMQSEG